jgi:serine/threonine protein kinase/class 3 adenylate cyclase
MIGKQFGPYKLEAKIGEGGMGVVYRALDTDLDRPVAIKLVHASTVGTGSESDESVARFLREAKAASRLQHPAIMTIYKFGVEEHTRYLAMEFIDGKTLKRVIAGRPMPVNEVCEIAMQMADGLAAAHERGVIHRDLKAENIMVTPRGQAKILDFGLAKIAEPEQKATDDATVDDFYKTKIGTVLGTVSNMSPEQALGHDVDEKADIFSLGVIFYEMTTGKNPYIGPTAQATMARILNQEPELVSEVNPSVPPELESLIHLCLRKDPRQRPSAKQVTSEFKRIYATLSVHDLVSDQVRGQAMSQPSMSGSAPISISTMPLSASQSPLYQPASAPVIQVPNRFITANIKPIYYALKGLRIGFALFTLTVPLGFFLYMMVSGGLIRPQFVEGTALWTYVKAIVMPALTAAENMLTVRPVWNGWNLLLAGLGGIAFVVRHLVMLPFEQAEHWAKTRMLKKKTPDARDPSSRSVKPGSDASQNRLSLLREYSEAQDRMAAGKQHLAFLSVDVVSAAKMKQGEDKMVVEHAFAEYQKFLDRILRSSNVWKQATLPEGTVAAFLRADDAVRAGQTVLNELAWFNDGVHRLRARFGVRCGVNAGEVNFPGDKNIGEVSDQVISSAGAMQKNAEPDSMLISREAHNELSSKEGFRMLDRQVDGRVTFEWKTTARASSQSAD